MQHMHVMVSASRSCLKSAKFKDFQIFKVMPIGMSLTLSHDPAHWHQPINIHYRTRVCCIHGLGYFLSRSTLYYKMAVPAWGLLSSGSQNYFRCHRSLPLKNLQLTMSYPEFKFSNRTVKTIYKGLYLPDLVLPFSLRASTHVVPQASVHRPEPPPICWLPALLRPCKLRYGFSEQDLKKKKVTLSFRS